METLRYISEGGVITPGETIVYVLIITLIALIGSNESCLINSFSFACYWGFKGLLQAPAAARGMSESMVILYFVSGVAMFVIVNLYYLRRDRHDGREFDEDTEVQAESESSG